MSTKPTSYHITHTTSQPRFSISQVFVNATTQMSSSNSRGRKRSLVTMMNEADPCADTSSPQPKRRRIDTSTTNSNPPQSCLASVFGRIKKYFSNEQTEVSNCSLENDTSSIQKSVKQVRARKLVPVITIDDSDDDSDVDLVQDDPVQGESDDSDIEYLPKNPIKPQEQEDDEDSDAEYVPSQNDYSSSDDDDWDDDSDDDSELESVIEQPAKSKFGPIPVVPLTVAVPANQSVAQLPSEAAEPFKVCFTVASLLYILCFFFVLIFVLKLCLYNVNTVT